MKKVPSTGGGVLIRKKKGASREEVRGEPKEADSGACHGGHKDMKQLFAHVMNGGTEMMKNSRNALNMDQTKKLEEEKRERDQERERLKRTKEPPPSKPKPTPHVRAAASSQVTVFENLGAQNPAQCKDKQRALKWKDDHKRNSVGRGDKEAPKRNKKDPSVREKENEKEFTVVDEKKEPKKEKVDVKEEKKPEEQGGADAAPKEKEQKPSENGQTPPSESVHSFYALDVVDPSKKPKKETQIYLPATTKDSAELAPPGPNEPSLYCVIPKPKDGPTT